jgi:adenosylcobinamide-GDP ribazoletransferase
MKPLIAAIQFLTILPLGAKGTYAPRAMIAWFPIVGLLLGILLAVFDAAVSRLWAPSAAAVLDMILLILLTGALHLDGLGDTADGLYGHRPVEKALSIMKDSRIGAMALVTVVAALALKWSGLEGMQQDRFLLLILIPAYARGAMLFGIRGLPYGRNTEGTGYDLFATPLTISDFAGLIGVVALSVMLGWTAIFLNLFFILSVLLILTYFRRKIGCITGDMLGAMTELIESALFFLMAIEVLG